MATKVELGPSCAAAPGVLDRGTFSPRALDLFCGAGGVSVGLQRAGFEVTGVDIKEQPNYRGGTFVLGDALIFPLDGFDFVWASPPCQGYTNLSKRWGGLRHPMLIPQVRERLVERGGPWVIENVPGAPLVNPVQLCGSSFGLNVRRHRLFEANFELDGMPCDHAWQTPRFRSLDLRRAGKLSGVVGVHGHLNYPGEFTLRCAAMGIDWMTNAELVQAIPPAYAQFIGERAIALLRERAA
jgi:DNA (cytosine-5)-methyltransferase 1